MWFIAALLTLGATYLYGKSGRTSDEIAIACIPIACCGLLITLVAAPWQIQLLLLAAILLAYPIAKAKLSG